MQIRPVGAQSFHEDRWTDGRTDRQREKLIVAFCTFANALRNCIQLGTVTALCRRSPQERKELLLLLLLL